MDHNVRLPCIPDSFSLLEVLDDDELEVLILCEENCEEFCDSLPQMQSMKDDIAMLRALNQTAADANLKREPQLREAREQLRESLETLEVVRASYESSRDTLSSYARSFSAIDVHGPREARCVEQEELAQSTADSFLQGSIPVEDFVADFMAQRKEAVVSRVHVDKLKELLSNPGAPAAMPQSDPIPYNQHRFSTHSTGSGGGNWSRGGSQRSSASYSYGT